MSKPIDAFISVLTRIICGGFDCESCREYFGLEEGCAYDNCKEIAPFDDQFEIAKKLYEQIQYGGWPHKQEDWTEDEILNLITSVMEE